MPPCLLAGADPGDREVCPPKRPCLLQQTIVLRKFSHEKDHSTSLTISSELGPPEDTSEAFDRHAFCSIWCENSNGETTYIKLIRALSAETYERGAEEP